jgi:hypothetical protein
VDQACGIGFVLYLSDSHYFIGKENVGRGSNNYGDLMLCWLSSNAKWTKTF